jgi:hypothetical protein
MFHPITIPFDCVMEKFSALLEHVDEADELGYRLLWQGEPENL